MKIYQQCTKNLINIDASFLKDYYSEHLYKFLAGLLQIVSFFTTYAGVELFFGDLFSLSTLFITLVIQIGLFVTSIHSNKPGKKNFRDKFLMTILLIVSIAFSYIGLITQVSSPEEDYEQAYKSYETVYHNKVDINLDSLSDEKIETGIKSQLGNVISILKLFDQKIIENIVRKQDLEKGGEPDERYISKVGDVKTDPEGTVTQGGNTFKTNPRYKEYIDKRDRYNKNISSLIQSRLSLVDAICNVTGKELKKYKKNKESKSYYENMDYKKIEEIFQNVSLASLFDGEKSDDKKSDEKKKGTGDSWTKEKCDTLIHKNNSVLKNEQISKAEYNSNKISVNLIENEIKEYRKGNALAKVDLKEWNDFKKEIVSPSDTEGETFIDKILYIAGSCFGADLKNAKMRNLIDLHQEMQKKVRDNYDVVSSYLDKSADGETLSELKERKEEIDRIPNLLFIGFSRFGMEGKHRSNAIICLILAIFNDFMTVILGYVGSRKAFSFLYVKSSNDYYNDIDELFGIVFKSMMQEFYISLRRGEFNDMDNNEFMEKCIQVVQKTSNAISRFLDEFTISECTSSMGYNLCFKYKTKDDIKKYKPIISVLLKTNMLKVVPYVYYQYLELEYYCGTKLPVWENDLGKFYNGDDDIEFEKYGGVLEKNKSEGNILLLRNRAENYLRENMYVDINVTEKETDNLPQVNEPVENK